MLRRWFVFGLALMLLSLCVTVWGVSYWRYLYARHTGTTFLNFVLNSGRMAISWISTPGARSEWHFANEEAGSWDDADKISKFSWLGFSYDVGVGMFYFTIPLWLPSLLSLLFLWFAWRKTRRKPKGKAFPIEPSIEARSRSV
jgi:hypothetical protein